LQKEDIYKGVHDAKIRIIGVGGGGGSIISEIASRIRKADFAAVNTDARALRSLNSKIKKIQFGQNHTNGLGTGMNVELAEQAALEDKEKLKKVFEGQDLCIIISCLGGGTSSGATHILAKMAKAAGCMTFGIFTLPFSFEGEKKAEIADQALIKSKPYFNVFAIIPNERIFQIIDKNTPLQEALSAINRRLVSNLEGLMEMIYSTGLINIDFADLKTILSGYGKLCYLNAVEIEESQKEEAARKVVSTSLYPYTLKGAKGILYNITGGKSLCLSDVSKLSTFISEAINPSAKIIFGINQTEKLKNRIRIALLAVGCGSGHDLLKKEKPDKNKTVKKKAEKQEQKIILKPKKPVVVPAKEEKPEEKQPEKVRRTALEVRKVIQEEERELLDKESAWETPAILRRKDK